MAKQSNDAIVTSSNKRIGAIRKYVTNKKTAIPIGGTSYTPDGLVAVYQDDLDNRAAVVTTKAAYEAAVAARVESTRQRNIVDESLKPWVLNTYGNDSAEAKVFGYAPRKMPTMTAHERADAVDANLATRAARGTVGKKQKDKIHGSPAETLATQATAPAAPPAANVANGATPAASVANGATPNGAGK